MGEVKTWALRSTVIPNGGFYEMKKKVRYKYTQKWDWMKAVLKIQIIQISGKMSTKRKHNFKLPSYSMPTATC